MHLTATVADLDEAQWAHLHESVPAAGFEFREGQTRVCATFTRGAEERHVEMPLMVFTALVQRLAHRGHRVPWHDMRTPAEIEAGGPVPTGVMPTVNGIRGHRVMTLEEADTARRLAERTPPLEAIPPDLIP